MQINYSRKIKGFSLIELLLVMAIMMTLGTVAVGLSSRLLIQDSVQNTSDYLVSTLRKAQAYAIAGKNDSDWGVKYQAGDFILYSATSSAFDESYSVNPNITVSGFTQVVFSKGTGLPTASASIGIVSGTNSKPVTVNLEGMVNN